MRRGPGHKAAPVKPGPRSWWALSGLLAACGPTPEDAPPWPEAGVVLTGARLVDATGVREGLAVVLVGDEVFALVDAARTPPSRLEVLDLSGRVLAPGLIDAHVHLAHAAAPWWVGDTLADNLRASLAHGVVAVADLGGPPWTLALRDRLASGALLGPRVRASGPFLTAEGSHPCELRRDPSLCTFVDGDGGDLARGALDDGADFVKAALQDGAFWDHPVPRLDLGQLAEICAVDPLAWVHVGAEADALDALAAGCRRLAHVPFGDPSRAAGPLDAVSSTISASAGLGRVLDAPDLDAWDLALAPAPTRAAWASVREDPGLLAEGWVEANAAWAAQARENLALWLAEGAPLLAGSDAGYFFVPHGAGLHWELEELLAAGASPAEALAAATTAPAAALGFDDLGLIAEGMRADLLVLEDDPLEDLAALRRPMEIWLAGEPWTPEDLAAAPVRLAPEPGGFCLDDGDCGDDRCDPLRHACAPPCGEPFADLDTCGPASWCAPADLLDAEQGICHTEPTCDWRVGGCGGEHYPETCVPRDLDTATCWPAGPRQEAEPCAWTAPDLACDVGLYCAPSGRCRQLCDPEGPPSCGDRPCLPVDDGRGGVWFGVCG